MPVASLRNFPRRDRVVYERNPLVEVVCAISFPAILELLQGAPAKFQRRFAQDYPFVEIQELVGTVDIATRERGKVEPRSLQSTYFFSDTTKQWKVSLQPSLLALTCSNYSEWKDFRVRFEAIAAAAAEIYQIGVMSRIGLRYKDVIDRGILELGDHPWTDLIKSEALGTFLFFTDNLEESDGGVSASIEAAIPPGLAKVQLAKVVNSATKNIGLLIDTDCFVQRDQPFDVGTLMRQADELHEYTSIVFHACITDLLHDALQKPHRTGKD